jgi:hypothetical protein
MSEVKPLDARHATIVHTLEAHALKLYKVGEIASWGHEVEGTYYTFSLQLARNEFARRIWKARKEGGLSVESRDGYAIKRGTQAFEKSALSITYWVGYSVSNENGTEWDEDPQEICLWEVEVEGAGLTTVNANRLAALERLYEASRRREYADEADEWQTAESEVIDSLAELEVLNDGNA